MQTLNDVKKQALQVATGSSTGVIPDLERKWLYSLVSPYKGSIPDMWRKYRQNLGYSNEHDFLVGEVGYSSSIPQLWKAYWLSFLSTNTLLLFENGDLLLLEGDENGHLIIEGDEA